MSEPPLAGPPDWAPPPPPPSEPPPYAPPAYQQPAPGAQPPQPPPQYWTPAATAPPAHRPQRGLVAILAGALVVLLLLVVVGGYALGGSLTASARVSSADNAIAQTQHIDFGTTLFQVKGGFDLSSSTFDPMAFSGAVNQFVSNVKDETSSLGDEEQKLQAAQQRLRDNGWLTTFSRGSLDSASTRVDHALKAIATAKTITGDLTQDGVFYQAWAASLIDFDDYVTAGNAGDATTAIAKIQAAKTDISTAASLAAAPGLDTGVQGFVTGFQTFINDLEKLINSSLSGDKAGQSAASTAAQADAAKLNAIDTSGFDGSIASFYDPLFKSYDQELTKAGD